MIATLWNLLALCTVEGSVLLLVAWALLSLWRHSASAAWRHLIWAAALAGLAALPVFIHYGPVVFGGLAPRAAAFGLLSPIRIVVTAEASGQQWDLPSLLVGLWAAGALVLLLRWTTALVAMQVLTSQARRSDSSDPQLEECCRQAGVNQPVQLRYSDRLTTPVVWGLWRPVIVLPAAVERASDTEQRRVIYLHELAHVQRRDWAELCLTQLTAALYWFHPLVWLAAREVRRERERACDDRVVELTATPERYAEQLLRVARTAAQRERFGAAMAMVTKSELEGRIMAILDETRGHGRVRWYGPLLAGLVTLGLLVPLAAVAQEKSGENKSESRPNKIRIGGNVMSTKLVSKVTPIYPDEAKRRGVQGVVLLDVLVGDDGAVQVVDVRSGPPELVTAAADAVRQWRYQPVLLNGQPIAVETTVEVNFTLAP